MGERVGVKKKLLLLNMYASFYLTSYSIHGAYAYFSFVHWFMILLDHCFTFEMSI